MGKPLALQWCRRCVAAHPEGQHRASPAKAAAPPPAKPIKDVVQPITAQPAPTVALPARSHAPQPVTAPKPKKDQSNAAKKVRKAVAKAAVTAETRAPAVMKAPKRQKPFKDPAKELARRRRQKADQMKRYRLGRKKRLEEQGLDVKGDLR